MFWHPCSVRVFTLKISPHSTVKKFSFYFTNTKYNHKIPQIRSYLWNMGQSRHKNNNPVVKTDKYKKTKLRQSSAKTKGETRYSFRVCFFCSIYNVYAFHVKNWNARLSLTAIFLWQVPQDFLGQISNDFTLFIAIIPSFFSHWWLITRFLTWVKSWQMFYYSDYCLMPNKQFSADIFARTSYSFMRLMMMMSALY